MSRDVRLYRATVEVEVYFVSDGLALHHDAESAARLALDEGACEVSGCSPAGIGDHAGTWSGCIPYGSAGHKLRFAVDEYLRALRALALLGAVLGWPR